MHLHLKILGIGCRKSRALKANVNQALARLPGLKAELDEVTSVHDILEYRITAAPALLINGVPAFEDEVPDVDELVQMFRPFMQKPEPMKKILVPTDFSDIAANAYRFAQRLAEEEVVEVKVVHAYHPSFDYSNPYLDMPAAEFESVKRELMRNFIAEHTLDTGPSGTVATVAKPKTELCIGFAGEEVVRLSREADLIVMGTTGQGNLMEKVFGSVSTHVARNAHCPVLLIPGGCRCQGFREIVFASNYDAADESILQQLMEMAGIGPANIHFVHVEAEAGKPYAVAKVEFEQAVRENMPGIGFNSIEIECSDIEEGIVRYAQEIGADLIAVGTLRRGFLENLFHKSVTKRLAFHTTVPLLVLHYER
ncbi:MAG: universal stress protein [Phaeodactylibacter sp.]|nr:universal stress protein [Phaeodactylibacter sp.]MCB9293266.1 universal stress protein [Lewinellaceae bacterium]